MLVIANWKAYVEDMERARELFSLSKRLTRDAKIKIVLAPPAPFLGTLSSKNKSSVLFAAQDVSATTGGARTGEVTAQAFAAAGADYALVGHSERRATGDTQTVVTEKLAHILAHGLTPILCVGEHERDSDGKYLSIVREQITQALGPLSLKERKQIIIAYEPVWAINKTAALSIAPQDLAEMVLYIRKVLGDLLLGKGSLRALVLYGGSIEPGNVRALAAASSVDGFLVGHASVDPFLFTQIVRELS